MQDILIKKLSNPDIDLDLADHSVSDFLKHELENAFLAGIPFQYLLEDSEFYHNHFYVNKDVLIPRQETEYLVDLIIRERRGKVRRVLDVGTGSGVILLSLLSHGTGEEGIGVDVSEDALHVADINRKRLHLETKAQLLKSDRLQNVKGRFDLIVSNPPYIKAIEHRSLVHQQVHSFEPHIALYLNDDAYDDWFNEFFKEVYESLEVGGVFYMEGHERELQKEANFLSTLGFENVSVLKDLTGTDRFLRAYRMR